MSSSSSHRSAHDRAVLRVALGEYDTGWHDPDASLARAEALIANARRAGARLVVLPEMATTGFSMESATIAEPVTGTSVTRLATMAEDHDVWLLAGVATKAADESARSDSSAACAYNSALLFSPRGLLTAVYHKQRLFPLGGEDRRYLAGGGPLVVDIDGVRLSPLICYDLRFPELFRAIAARVDLFVIIANWPVERREHWDVLVRARAIENQCYVVAVNRTGSGGGLSYNGGSVAYDPWGEEAPSILPAATHIPRIVEIDAAAVAELRTRYPFLPAEELGMGTAGTISEAPAR